MHPKRFARRTVLWGTILAAGLCMTTSYGQQPMGTPAPTVQVDPKTGALIVPLGGLVSFDPKTGPADSIVVSREDIIKVKPNLIDPKLLDISGVNTGLSQLTVNYKDGKKTFDVVVQPDLNLLRNIIKRTVPTAAVEVSPGLGQAIILSGYVTSPQDADIVTRLAVNAAGGQANAVINALQVGGGQHVQIDVVIASVDRNMVRNRGLDFFIGGSQANFTSIVSGLLGGTQQVGGTAANLLTVSPAANMTLGIVHAPFFAALQALRTEGIAKFIAEPRVVTQSGRPARLMSGGQQAVVSQNTGLGSAGAELKDFGTIVDVLPIVYANGQIWLEVRPNVSSVNFGLGIVINGTATPGFTKQELTTSVMLESGQTYAIGGLIQNSVQATSSKVPVLGDLPFVGIGFSKVTHDQRESELVILVTPRLVGPMNCDQVPKRLPGRETRNPDDYELFLENILEAPRGQRKVWNGRCYNAAWKCDPTAAIFPCVGNACTGAGAGGATCGPVVGGYSTPMTAPSTTVPATLPAAAPGSGIRVLPAIPGGTGEGDTSALPAAPPVVIVPQVPGN